MKYIQFGESKPEDADKLMEIRKKMLEDRKKNPEKYAKVLFPTHQMGGVRNGKSFSVVDATEEQIMNVKLLYGPLVKLEYVPIFETDKVNEYFQKMKK